MRVCCVPGVEAEGTVEGDGEVGGDVLACFGGEGEVWDDGVDDDGLVEADGVVEGEEAGVGILVERGAACFNTHLDVE